MLDLFVFALNAVMPIILLIALGYVLKKNGLFTKEFLKVGNKTVFRVLLPVLLFTNLAKMDGFSVLRGDLVIYVVLAIALLFIIGLILAYITPDKRQKGVLHQCVFRSNFALIGVPLAQLIAGDSGVQSAAVLSTFTIPIFNISAVIALSAYTGNQTAAGPKIKKILRDIAHNPLLWGVLAGVLYVFIKPFFAMLPATVTDFCSKFTFLWTALDYLAKASTPVSLLVLGGQFELSHIKGLRKQILLGVSGRLLFAPVLGIGSAVLLQYLGILHFDSGIYAALIALFATPVAVASAIMAEEMDNDGSLAGQLVVWTTLLSSVVIFLAIVLLRGLGML
ncbi:MAG: AEC family transporter [Lachnospiraceae bacterium]|nr:AEC family transporter [Lachnospiraceae bacterium]